MFTIYNNGSVQFRNSSDNLYSIDIVDESSESRLKPDDDFYHYLGKRKGKDKYTNEAINSYKKIAKMDTMEIVYHVDDIMTHKCIVIDKERLVLDAYEALKEKQITQIPIVTQDGKIVNLINKKVILNLLMDDINNHKEILNRRLDSLDLPQFITADPISDIRRVAKVMIERKLDAIPVVDQNDFLVGIVSKTDIIRTLSYIPNLKLWA